MFGRSVRRKRHHWENKDVDGKLTAKCASVCGEGADWISFIQNVDKC
jgi:hypothetical protein